MSSFPKIISSIFLLVLIFSLDTAESREVEELKICEMGIRQCKMLVKNVKKYRVCMRKNCESFYFDRSKKKSFEYTEEEDDFLRRVAIYSERQGQELEKVEMCDFGRKKCNKLNMLSPDFYWECIIDSCGSSKRLNYDENCNEGKKQCQSKLDAYNICMSYNCPKDRRTGKRLCAFPEKICESEINQFWSCMYGQCLGPIGKYVNPYINRKYVIIVENGEEKIIKTDINKKSYSPGAQGPGLRTPPRKGIKMEEWGMDTPSRFMLIGNPSDRMRCRNSADRLRCVTRDIRSCICSDGSTPIYRDGKIPKPLPLDVDDI